MADNTPTVAIVGAGFGGLRAAQALAGAPVRVVLLDRRNYHLFQPLLYQVAVGGLSPGDIAYPVRTILRRQRNVEFRMAEVTGVDFASRRLQTSHGELAYDYLVLAIGGATHYFGLDSIARSAFGLKDLGDAVAIRNHVLCNFEAAVQESNPDKRRAMLTVVVVGGGPTGVECAGAFSELARLVLAKDYAGFNVKDVRVILLEATDRLLSGMPETLGEATAETLWRKHVEVRFGAQVVDFDGERVTLKGGEIIPARTLVWAAGVQAAELAGRLGVPQARQARIVVRPTLQLPDHERVYAIGDAAYLEDNGQPLPMVAPVAMQQAGVAAGNILRSLEGKPLQAFAYRDLGTMATIGRNAAVARLGRWESQGFVAWLVWLVVHLMQLIGFRNRLVVLINWAWDYLFYERAVRLITAE